jgi:uncharacterized membrane protein (DUF4010 family)
MEILGLPLHSALAISAAVLGPVGCLVALWYAFRPDHRDAWRYPMLITAVLATAAIFGAYVSGEQMLADHPELADDAQVVDHQQYAARLVLPTVGYFVMATLSALLNPRTGALRVALPILLTAFSVVVLVLVALSGDEDARSLWEAIRGTLDVLDR